MKKVERLKHIYAGDVDTVTVPYIPGNNGEPSKPDYFYENVKIEGFELYEIVGSQLTLIDGEWTELGFYAKYRQVTKEIV